MGWCVSVSVCVCVRACARVCCVCLQCDFPFLSLASAQLSSGSRPPPHQRVPPAALPSARPPGNLGTPVALPAPWFLFIRGAAVSPGARISLALQLCHWRRRRRRRDVWEKPSASPGRPPARTSLPRRRGCSCGWHSPACNLEPGIVHTHSNSGYPPQRLREGTRLILTYLNNFCSTTNHRSSREPGESHCQLWQKPVWLLLCSPVIWSSSLQATGWMISTSWKTLQCSQP